MLNSNDQSDKAALGGGIRRIDFSNNGHAILVITGLCQEYGALTLTEIKDYVTELGFSNTNFQNLLYCSELLSWIKKIKKGNQTFYVAIPSGDALELSFLADVKNRDKSRWRSDIRTYWKDHDKPRHRAITEAVLSASVVK